MMISIITVTLNDLSNLKLTAISLLEQTDINFQWIIKDGLSDDGTNEYINTLKNTTKIEIDYIQEKDSSLYEAMNQAMFFVKGTYTLFLNAGDYLYSNEIISKLKKEVRCITDYDFIYGDNYDLSLKGDLIFKKARPISYLKHSLPTSHQAIFYNTCLFSDYKYPLNYKICGDYAFTSSIYFSGNRKHLILDMPISVFQFGGLSQLNRKLLLSEAYDIHRINGDNYVNALIKYVKSYLTIKILDNHTSLYKLLRRIDELIFKKKYTL